MQVQAKFQVIGVTKRKGWERVIDNKIPFTLLYEQMVRRKEIEIIRMLPPGKKLEYWNLTNSGDKRFKRVFICQALYGKMILWSFTDNALIKQRSVTTLSNMATKKQSHTGFRNGDLFCFNCGTSYKLNLPQIVSMASAMMKQFDKDHRNCEKTWTEPTSESNGKTEEQNAQWWAENGEQGVSSKTMFNHLAKSIGVTRLKNDWQGSPSDPDDFKRCYKLLQAVPQWKNRLNELKTISPTWEKLVDNWDKLTAMYEQNVKEDWKNYKKVGMYEFMKSLGC